jgi:hypothetical protein
VIKVVTPRLAFVAASSLGEEVVEVAEVAVMTGMEGVEQN